MARSSIMGGDRAPQQTKGRNAESLGPSDTSDSGSDIQGSSRLKTDAEEGQLGGATPVRADSDSDSMGTGERGSKIHMRVLGCRANGHPAFRDDSRRGVSSVPVAPTTFSSCSLAIWSAL